MKQFFFLCTTLLLLGGCTNQQPTDSTITISVDLRQAVDITASTDFSIQEINLDEKGDLDTRSGALRSAISTDSTLVFFTDINAYLLDRDGNLIRKLGEQGRAANEYIKIGSLFLKQNGHILISDVAKLLEYTPDGKFLKKHDIANDLTLAFPLVGDRFYSNQLLFSENGDYCNSLTVYNQNFEILHQVDSLSAIPAYGCTSADNSNEFLFFDLPLKINLLTTDFKIKEKYILDFGKDNPIPVDNTLSSFETSTENVIKRATLALSLHDTKDALYFDVICGESFYIVRFEKKSGIVTSYRVFKNDKPIISMDSRFSGNRYNYTRRTENGIIVGIVVINE